MEVTMAKLVAARAWCNNEVAYLAWRTDGPIDGCLGFMITRIHLDQNGQETARRNLPTWVAFDTQSNPEWEPQDTSVWPVQKFSWRDLTLRRSRDSLVVRPDEFWAKYEITPVGLPAPARAPVPPSPTAQPGKYKGKAIPLFICGDSIVTDTIEVTRKFDEFEVAFTNGILSTQNLRKQLKTPKGKVPSKADIDKHIAVKGDAIRTFLAGDVLPALRSLFDRAELENGEIHLALYELADPELIDLLIAHQKRLNLILCTAGSKPPAKGSGGKTVWDVTNAAVRGQMKKLIGKRLHNRFFNNSAHIGHNKFAVLSAGGTPRAVWTGSTNWTQTGLCAQTNNTLIVESPEVAKAYLAYWTRLRDDKLPTPKPPGSQLASDQGITLRKADMTPVGVPLNGSSSLELWYSPNTAKTGTPATRTVPPDLARAYQLMKAARHAIFFLVFNPGRTADEGDDVNTVVAAAINFGRLDPSLLVMGAISDPTAVPGFEPLPEGVKPKKGAPKIPQRAIFSPAGVPGVVMVRAAAIGDLIGDFQRELLSAGHAIIHDKIVVIDPLSKDDCVVITGSHNLGFKASYANDENMLIIRGKQDLALAYAVHVLDVYDHYKFRAALEQQARDAMLSGKPRPKHATGRGFLSRKDDWQDPYFDGRKGRELDYFVP
jgi:phosphatidylserine/phosphatidylglycerophosphate/cardiolipin synthase-like enzyme